MSEIVFTEKACSWCLRLNWDSETGLYNETCTSEEHAGEKCNTDGPVYNWDAEGDPVHDD